jgi:hypothetical protein
LLRTTFESIHALRTAKPKLSPQVHFRIAFTFRHLHTAYGIFPVTWRSVRGAVNAVAAMSVNHVGATAESHHEVEEQRK